MLVANDIDLLRVMNAAMIVTKRVQPTIGRMLIRVDDSARQHSFLHERFKRTRKDVGDYSRNDVALTFDRSGNDGFVFAGSTAFLPASAIAAHVSFVNFDSPAQ